MALIGQLADPNYRYSINEFTGTGLQVNWEINFAGGYIEKDHVKAVVLDPLGNALPRDIAWAGDSTVVIQPPVPDGHTLTIYRDTPKVEPLADFVDNAVINEVTLDRNARQAVFIAAETADQTYAALAAAEASSRQAADFAAVAVAAAGGADLSGAVAQFDGRILTKTNASAVGVTGSASNMGTTPGTILSDNGTAKAWFQEIETLLMALREALDSVVAVHDSLLTGAVPFDLPDEAAGDAIPAPGSGLPYLSGGVFKIA